MVNYLVLKKKIKNAFLNIMNIVLLSSYSYSEEKIYIPYPIGYSIPEKKMVKEIPEKTQDFASIIPGSASTYIYTEESDYYADYQRSFFAVTTKKGGWDCLRHYEILANGCIPYFLDLDKCDSQTMYFLPKDLILEAMHMEGVSYLHIDHTKFDLAKYYEILNKLLEHTRAHLTTSKMATYLLESVGYLGDKKILVLSQNSIPEYLRDLCLIGLKENLQDRVVDVPKIPHIYDSYLNPGALYGRGMTYTRNVPDFNIDRTGIADRIRMREFDLVIYAEMHKGGLPFYNLVKEYYSSEEIVYIYCEEEWSRYFEKYNLPNLFIREYYLYKSGTPAVPKSR